MDNNSNNLKFVRNFCIWEDLLGYGKPFYDNNWDLHNEDTLRNIKRIYLLQEEIKNPSDVFLETTFALNDGFIKIFDIPNNSVMAILHWLQNALFSFSNINKKDIANGFFGIRGVLTYGERVQYIPHDTLGRGEFIQTSEKRKIEYNHKKIIYTPGELQMNTAFSKAYIIESSGSRMGITGNKFYIDIDVLKKLIHLINAIGRDRILLTDEDEKKYGPLYYNYNVKFDTSVDFPELLVTVKSIESEWEYFKIIFEKIVEYNNISKAICTELLVPKIIKSSLFSKDDELCFEM